MKKYICKAELNVQTENTACLLKYIFLSQTVEVRPKLKDSFVSTFQTQQFDQWVGR
jgi:hypothetical protein